MPFASYLTLNTIICKDCEWFQVKIRIGTKKKDGPVSGLKSAGPHGRFQSFGAAGPVSYYRDLEISLRGYSSSLKLVPFESLGVV